MFGARIAITGRLSNGLLYAYQRDGNEVTLLGVDEHLTGRSFLPVMSLSLSNFVLMAGIPEDASPSTTLPGERVHVYNIRQPLQ
jgi:hypothetical protein